MDNYSQQLEEIESLTAIYDKDWVAQSMERCYSIDIQSDVRLYITFRPDYPSSLPPIYELLAPNLDTHEKVLVSEKFEQIYMENCGCPIVFQWIEKLKEIISDVQTKTESKSTSTQCETNSRQLEVKKSALKITHGSTLIDKKSVFQGHVCVINGPGDVKEFLDQLLENKKVAQATHNISAYRITLPNNKILEDCDDDGEKDASAKILLMLQKMNVTNVMVVVTRWYGGIHLGPERFRNINKAAKQALTEAGFI